jgi:hypothetical protein
MSSSQLLRQKLTARLGATPVQRERDGRRVRLMDRLAGQQVAEVSKLGGASWRVSLQRLETFHEHRISFLCLMALNELQELLSIEGVEKHFQILQRGLLTEPLYLGPVTSENCTADSTCLPLLATCLAFH